MNLNWYNKLDSDKVRTIFGNTDSDALTNGYSKKLFGNVSVKGLPVSTDNINQIWMKESAVSRSGNKLVYINVPFCQTRCSFCGFFKNFIDDDTVAKFSETLIKEIRQSSNLPLFRDGEINAVYIGGGTPGAMSKHQITELLKAVNESLPLANDCEISFETRTYKFTSGKIEACIDNGVNRFSLGVQSFDTRARQAIGRTDDGDMVARKIEELKSYNQASVSVDLMYGLPYQSENDFIDDIIMADRLCVDGLSLYQLNVFEDSRLEEKIRAGKLPSPKSTAQNSIYHIKSNKLMQNLGYRQSSISHWTRGTRDRNLYNLMSKQEHIVHGFGAGAGGRMGRYEYYTHIALEPYYQMVNEGKKPIMGMNRKHENHILYSIITGQMNCGFLRFDQLNRNAGTDLFSLFEPLISSWEEREMVEVNGNVMNLTPAGQFWYLNMTRSMLDVLVMAENEEYRPEVMRVASYN